MQTPNHQPLSYRNPSSPLQSLNLNTPLHSHSSPNTLHKPNNPPQLKRRFTTQIPFKPHPLTNSSRNVNFKENVAPQQKTKFTFTINPISKYSMEKGNSMGPAIHPTTHKHKTPINIQPFTIEENIDNEKNIQTNNYNIRQIVNNTLIHTTNKTLIQTTNNTPKQTTTTTPINTSRPTINIQHQSHLNASSFEKIKELGKGKFGVVWLVRHQSTHFVCAMKQIKKSVVREEKVQHQIAKQIRIHNALKHQNIIDFYGFFNDQQNFYILTEYATSGVVYSLLKANIRVDEQQASDIVKQTAEGLKAMHEQGYIHRDIKPQNLIMQFNTVKLCDLGWAAECNSNHLRKSLCGTPLYYSPQMVQHTPHNHNIDIWSLGLLTYELIIGRIPFRIWSQFDLHVILEQDVKFPDYVDVEKYTQQFILNCLKKNMKERPSLQEIINSKFLKVERTSDTNWEQQFSPFL